MFTIPVINVKTDPLDALLAGLGLRIQTLAKSRHNEAFNNLIKDKVAVIEFSSPQMSRHYRFDNGLFSQEIGKTTQADLSIEFTDSMMGAKLLAKGDVAALMTAIQDGKVKITGDYKLVLWFAGIGKQAATVPDEYRTYVEQAKTYAQLAKPYAQSAKELFDSVKQKLGK
ncbi:hypothetical protein [Moraxella nasicaprae]|uniref:SCP2 domain-containing protein n=1 Tax=Moraxella nasicaprae TaxID=2904122 RepID=A0ABY6F6E6_9GAMM|nr:hypothetical protein [Moraxella nasicaprae]UXZ05450.1 hypothetical protein LU297_03085 [Moraxella nasicaprae]